MRTHASVPLDVSFSPPAAALIDTRRLINERVRRLVEEVDAVLDGAITDPEQRDRLRRSVWCERFLDGAAGITALAAEGGRYVVSLDFDERHSDDVCKHVIAHEAWHVAFDHPVQADSVSRQVDLAAGLKVLDANEVAAISFAWAAFKCSREDWNRAGLAGLWPGSPEWARGAADTLKRATAALQS